jgi:hypothetical protein
MTIDDELARGAVIVSVGSKQPFAVPADDWFGNTVISVLNGEARIIVVMARRPGSLTRLVAAIKAAGLTPVIVEPMGQIMPHILKMWGWHRAIIGEGRDRMEEWRP